MGTSTRRKGREFDVALWLARHPGAVLLPGSVSASVMQLGATTTASIAGGAAAGLLAWYRGHPDSFDTVAAPRFRAWWRRWASKRYTGIFWRDTLLACDLVRENRKTQELYVPRIVKIRSFTPSIDTLWVRLVPGQSAKAWIDKTEELADALKVERVSVEKVRPQIIALVVQRTESFTEVIDAPDMPTDAELVDLTALCVGETEYGDDFTLGVQGQHVLDAGATGSGKNSLGWSLLRQMAPMIREGSVRVWGADPKEIELAPGKDAFYRYAADEESIHEMVSEYHEDLRDTKAKLKAAGLRKFTPSPETPFNLLLADELGAIVGFGDMTYRKDYRSWFPVIGTQGRATGHGLLGMVQEPNKDTVPFRDLFTTRLCLRVTAAQHVDMALGDDARLRGALADEIPNDPATAGIGYVVRQRSRTPMRIRLSYVDDAEIEEFVRYVTGGPSLRVVAA
ncbi:cell division protein FtsK [Allokutzneria oryzae]|uniref:Cell division protein FtsK n=1 Tax=Allokutzneria oryzae TaxID=1378989 RepID=A0ABV6A9C1_9PSEU